MFQCRGNPLHSYLRSLFIVVSPHATKKRVVGSRCRRRRQRTTTTTRRKRQKKSTPEDRRRRRRSATRSGASGSATVRFFLSFSLSLFRVSDVLSRGVFSKEKRAFVGVVALGADLFSFASSSFTSSSIIIIIIGTTDNKQQQRRDSN